MSIREARLCDYGGCDNPASGGACPLCKRDCCARHSSKKYITVAVVLGHSEGSDATRLGQSPRVTVCDDCAGTLSSFSVTFNFPGKAVLDTLVAPMTSKLIEAASAFLAEKKLEKKGDT